MTRTRKDPLTSLRDRIALTDLGLETDLVFHHGCELPYFASFVLVDDHDGIELLRSYFREHAAVAAASGTGFVFEAPTWRASPDLGERIGYTLEALADTIRKAVELLVEVRAELDSGVSPALISGSIGPRGDAYSPTTAMSESEARDYHRWQIERLAETDADLVTAMTLTYTAEAIGIVRAADAAGMPVVISFTVETDGRLPDGTPLGEAITAVDDATAGAAAYFMVNCAHPTHFEHALDPTAPWTARIRGLRANASRKSHAELDESEELDDGDPVELATDHTRLLALLPHVSVLGGCCGTDIRHVRAIAAACLPSE